MKNKELKIYNAILKNPYSSLEILEFFLGNLIGDGSSRWVFDYDKNTVLKVEKGDWHANTIEWDTWMGVKYTKWEKWFAPVLNISDNGRLLWMQKCNKLYEQPKRLPTFLGDVRLNNLGELNGRIVCIDYSINNFISNGLKNSKILKLKEPI